MIRINLLGEKVDHSFRYLLEGVGFFAAIAIAVFACIIWQSELESTADSLKREESRLRIQLARLEKVTREIDGLESKKKTLREKLQTISLLKAKKHGPVHILDDVNMALPDRAWLSSMKEKSGILEISGVALDNQTLAVFMNNLAKAPYFKNVELLISTEYVQDAVKLQQFSLAVTLLDPLKKKDPVSVQSVTFDAEGKPIGAGVQPASLVVGTKPEELDGVAALEAATAERTANNSVASDNDDAEEGDEPDDGLSEDSSDADESEAQAGEAQKAGDAAEQIESETKP